MIEDMDRSIQIKALSSETRLKILQLLSRPEDNFAEQWSADPKKDGVCMSLIAEALELSQPTVSRHLDILKRADFISVRQFQKWSHCKREDQAIREYLDWLGRELVL